MGIDIYMRWKGITVEERESQITGFSIAHGHCGYLREAYHGGPYATKVLVPEAFDENACEARCFGACNGNKTDAHDGRCNICGEWMSHGAFISAETLMDRLPEAVEAAKERERTIYHDERGEDSPAVQSLRAFVSLAAQKQDQTGEPCLIIASW